MTRNILFTGASGYLGGSFLQLLKDAGLPGHKIYAVVRSDKQAEAVQQYNAEPLTIDLSNTDAITSAIVDNNVTVVFHLHNPLDSTTPAWIKALAAVKQRLRQDVHFIFTTGAKLFSSHAGAPSEPFSDSDPGLYVMHKGQAAKAPIDAMGVGTSCNTLVTETAEAHGVKSYIFVPCIVYGRGLGFGNKISIQTVAVVRAAKATGRVFKVDNGRPTWPVCHVEDNSTLYLEMLRGILEERDIGHGKNGYFLASPGSVAWDDIYTAMAKALKKRGVIGDEEIQMADRDDLAKMGEGLDCPADFVPLMLGGLCPLTPEHGRSIGWTPKYGPEHILEAADAEVELILEHLDGARSYAIPQGTKLKQ
ncbi:NAD(P)-binding protein [Bimuria novae-zelandiae CBS 107.79]|uniref:NAD(P)-binding protein n=1 Tax=Bimuria novae-zelandiae CBS 107.79 TaxID=1447943 RepID=A0A6A5UZ80_9PLEO|nr:NAD(P)-binding protein [Bimuria novae-zelandiae CBS 107.79]